MIIAQWTNEERTRSVMLDMDGTVSVIERDKPYHTWGPPLTLHMESAIDELREMLEVVNIATS